MSMSRPPKAVVLTDGQWRKRPCTTVRSPRIDGSSLVTYRSCQGDWAGGCPLFLPTVFGEKGINLLTSCAVMGAFKK